MNYGIHQTHLPLWLWTWSWLWTSELWRLCHCFPVSESVQFLCQFLFFEFFDFLWEFFDSLTTTTIAVYTDSLIDLEGLSFRRACWRLVLASLRLSCASSWTRMISKIYDLICLFFSRNMALLSFLSNFCLFHFLLWWNSTAMDTMGSRAARNSQQHLDPTYSSSYGERCPSCI